MWTSILVGAVCGGLAAVAASAIIRKPKELPIPFAVLLVIAFIGFKWVADGYVVPSLGGPTASSSSGIAIVDTMLSEYRFFRVLEKHEPEVHARVRDELIQLARTSASPQEARRRGFNLGRRMMTEMFLKRAGAADDKSLATLSSVFVKALRQLDRRDPVACYDWMFGGMRQMKVMSIIDQRTQNQLLDSMTDVIESAATHPSTTVASQSELQDLFRPLAESNDPRIRTGASIFMGMGPAFDRDSKAAACYTAVEVYARIKALPAYRAGPVLRAMFSQA